MSRAALLPFPGDPFLLTYWLKFFFEVWGDEVDHLYIGLNSPIEECVVEYIKDLANNPKVTLLYLNYQADHGPVINDLLDLCKEEYIVLLEDDCFIFKKGIVDSCFAALEDGTYDIVGSKRGSCSIEISKKAQEKWALAYEGEGDQGCNFWPNTFFSKKELLLKTDRNFSAKAWMRGALIEELGWVVDVDLVNGDTFVNTSLQLRAMVPGERIGYVPQYHAHPDDLRHYEQGKYLFDGKAPWVHIGSLSSGINVGGLLRDANNRPLAQRTVMQPEVETKLPVQYCQSEMEHKEFERRVQIWLTCIEYFNKESLESSSKCMQEFAILYLAAVEQIINQFGLNRKEIRKRQEAFKQLMQI
jgi:hypothetical protein